MKLEGLTANITFDQFCATAMCDLTNKQKVELAKRCAYYGQLTDMSYVEDLLVMAAATFTVKSFPTIDPDEFGVFARRSGKYV